MGEARAKTIDGLTDQLDDVDIRLFVVATDVVAFTDSTTREYPFNGRAMVFDKQPISNIQAIAIDRERFAFERVENHQWDQFFRKLTGSIIVGAVRDQHWQSIGMLVGSHKVIRGRFAGRVGAIGGVCRFLREQAGTAKGTIDFVGRDMKEAKGILRRAGQLRIV